MDGGRGTRSGEWGERGTVGGTHKKRTLFTSMIINLQKQYKNSEK